MKLLIVWIHAPVIHCVVTSSPDGHDGHISHLVKTRDTTSNMFDPMSFAGILDKIQEVVGAHKDIDTVCIGTPTQRKTKSGLAARDQENQMKGAAILGALRSCGGNIHIQYHRVGDLDTYETPDEFWRRVAKDTIEAHEYRNRDHKFWP